MSPTMHGTPTIQTPRKHIVPTHLNLPDQVLTLWSFSLSARQLLLLLVGGGTGGTAWQHLAGLGHDALLGQVLRLCMSLLPFLLALILACYRHAGRSLEVWLVVLLRYQLRPKCYLWRSIRWFEPRPTRSERVNDYMKFRIASPREARPRQERYAGQEMRV